MKILRTVAITALLLCSSCASAQIPGPRQTTVVSLEEIDCASCGYQIAEDLRLVPGVYEVRYDPEHAEVHVVASPEVEVFQRVRRLAATQGVAVLLGEGKGSFAADQTFPAGIDYQRITVPPERRLELRAILVAGKTTVVDFTATWCQSCREVDAHMLALMTQDPSLAYRKVDIGDWNTAVAEQYLAEVPALPYVVVFDAAGREAGRISGLDLDALDAAIRVAAAGAEPALW
jgi:thiol-disulfide isomerase/thioredoxin